MILFVVFFLATQSQHLAAAVPPGDLALPPVDTLVTFYWIGDREQGAAIRAEATPFELFEIDVPPGFEVQHWWYGEGLLTGLHYPDGTSISLHFGGNMSLPGAARPGSVEVLSPTGHGRAFTGVAEQGTWESHIHAYGLGSVWFEDAPPECTNLLRRSLSSIRYRNRAG